MTRGQTERPGNSRSGVDLRGQGQAQTASGQTAAGQAAHRPRSADRDPAGRHPAGAARETAATISGAAFVQALGAMLRLLNNPDGECYAHRI